MGQFYLKFYRLFFVFVALFFPMFLFADFVSIEQPKSSKTENEMAEKNENQGAKGAKVPGNSAPAKKGDAARSDKDLENHNSKAPVTFRSQSADGSKKTGILNLIGDVFIKQGEVSLESEKAQLFSKPGFFPSATNVIKALASGNVRMHRDATLNSQEIFGTAEKIEYLMTEKTIILTGNVKLQRGEEMMNGAVIKINLITGDIFAQNPSGLVKPSSAKALEKKE